MKYVLDSNVALKWVLPEHDSPQAVRLRDDFRSGTLELLAPDVFPIETAHALTRAERQKRIPVGEASQLLRDLLTTAPYLHSSISLLPAAVDLSSRYRIGVYDCLYIALAEREGCDLVTADDRLIASVPLPFVTKLS